MKAAIFLDRDGVICVNRPGYIRSWDEFEFLSGALEALRLLSNLGWPVVVVSNQSVVGRGMVSIQEVDLINSRMVDAVRAAGGRLDAVYYCPHTPEQACECRKPKPGMLIRAAQELDLDLGCSYLVGDAESDLQAALAVGVMPVLVLTGRGLTQIEKLVTLDGKYELAKDLLEAVEWIVQSKLPG